MNEIFDKSCVSTDHCDIDTQEFIKEEDDECFGEFSQVYVQFTCDKDEEQYRLRNLGLFVSLIPKNGSWKP